MPMKYVIAQSGTHQLRVEEDDLVEVDQLTSEIGDRIELPVILLSDSGKVKVGSPLVDKASVEAKVISQGKGKKVNILKFKRRKHSMKQQGHRQLFTEIQIGKIKA